MSASWRCEAPPYLGESCRPYTGVTVLGFNMLMLLRLLKLVPL
jgi:hypothetical protein